MLLEGTATCMTKSVSENAMFMTIEITINFLHLDCHQMAGQFIYCTSK